MKLNRYLSAAILLVVLLCFVGVTEPVYAGSLYDSFGYQSPKVIQDDDTVGSDWDKANQAKRVATVTPGTKWTCGLTNIGTTLTECRAAPGASLSLYLTDVVTQSNTATAGLFTLRFGTGTNCGTGTGNLFFASAAALMASPANTAPVNHFHLTTPMVVTANNAVCVLGVVTNTTNVQLVGYTAP